MRNARSTQARSIEKRKRIIDKSMEHFAQFGFKGTSMDKLARDLRIAKASIFQHFGSKEGLFLETYKAAVGMFPSYLGAPAEVLSGGFFEAVRYWLRQSEHLVREDLIPYRVYLVGNYGVDLGLRLEINRFLRSSDPLGSLEFVRIGLERNELRDDLDPALIASTLDWFVDRFQDALLMEELDQGLFRHTVDEANRREKLINEAVEIIKAAIGRRTCQC